MKQRQQLFQTHSLSDDPNNVTYYNTYNNKLNQMKDVAKKEYFQRQFRLNSENQKTTWKLIGMIIKRKQACAQPLITKLILKNWCYTDKASIAHQPNTHFINIGCELPPNNDHDSPIQFQKFQNIWG